MRLGVHFGPVFISSGGRRYRRASKPNHRLTLLVFAALVVLGAMVRNPWFALPAGVAVAMVVTYQWLKHHPKPPAESAPVAGSGSAGREQQVRR